MGIMVPKYNLSTQETEAGDQELEAILGDTAIPSLKQK
jgi:hypothetical protein